MYICIPELKLYQELSEKIRNQVIKLEKEL